MDEKLVMQENAVLVCHTKEFLQGIVVSEKNDKTIVVKVERQLPIHFTKSTIKKARSLWLMTKLIMPTKVTK